MLQVTAWCWHAIAYHAGDSDEVGIEHAMQHEVAAADDDGEVSVLMVVAVVVVVVVVVGV